MCRKDLVVLLCSLKGGSARDIPASEVMTQGFSDVAAHSSETEEGGCSRTDALTKPSQDGLNLTAHERYVCEEVPSRTDGSLSFLASGSKAIALVDEGEKQEGARPENMKGLAEGEKKQGMEEKGDSVEEKEKVKVEVVNLDGEVVVTEVGDGGVYDEVEIEDLEFVEEDGTFYFPCPCGDRFQITLVSFFSCVWVGRWVGGWVHDTLKIRNMGMAMWKSAF